MVVWSRAAELWPSHGSCFPPSAWRRTPRDVPQRPRTESAPADGDLYLICVQEPPESPTFEVLSFPTLPTINDRGKSANLPSTITIRPVYVNIQRPSHKLTLFYCCWLIMHYESVKPNFTADKIVVRTVYQLKRAVTSLLWEKEGIPSPIVLITCIKTPFSPVVFLGSYNFYDVVFYIMSWFTVPVHCSRLISNNKRFTYLLTYKKELGLNYKNHSHQTIGVVSWGRLWVSNSCLS